MEFGKSLYSLDGFVSLDDSNHKIIDENGCVSPRENEEIDIYLFAYLRDFALCLRDYYTLTGYPALIPKYALGNWWTSNKPYKQQEVIKLIDNFDKKNWVQILEKSKCKTNNERAILNSLLYKFDVEKQAAQISSLLESES